MKTSRLSRWLKWVAGAALLCGMLLSIAAAALWIWAGSEGSLSTALHWAARLQPVTAEGVSGSLRAGGRVRLLQWESATLRVRAEDVALTWQPLTLLEGRLRLERLSASLLRIEDLRGSKAQAVPAPPETLTLPLQVSVLRFELAHFEWAGTPAFEAHALAGRYDYDALRHSLQLDHAQVASGRYQARASLGARDGLALDATISGVLTTRVPGGSASLPLSFDASLHGPLADIGLRAILRTGTTSTVAIAGPHATATARITAWAAQPLPNAEADLRDVDLAALWPRAPQTRLSGEVRVQPGGARAWEWNSALSNALPGPWDRGRLPVQRLQAEGEWRDGVVMVHSLNARLGGGRLQATGEWLGAAHQAQTTDWRIRAHWENVNPAALHSRLAPQPLHGQASVEGIGGTLSVQSLRLRTREATLDAQLDITLATRSGSGHITLSAPGLQAQAQGTLSEASGKGTLSIDGRDLAQATTWLRSLPGMPAALPGAVVQGRGQLQLAWQGGWRDPALQGQLDLPTLTLRSTPTLPAGAVRATSAPLEIRAGRITLEGRLSQARLGAQGRMQWGVRHSTFDVTAHGGRERASAPTVWQGTLDTLHLSVQDPALGPDPWRIDMRRAVPLRWNSTDGSFEAAAGEALLRAPDAAARLASTRSAASGASAGAASATEAVIAWQPLRRRAGQLSSAGRITGLPLAWVELLGGPQLSGSAVTGNLMFDGEWDAQLGETLRLRATLARSRGDITVLTETTDGVPTRVAAGVREARLTLRSDADTVNLSLRWDSERAGTIDGQATTRLSPGAEAAGWRWPDDAPLSGRLRAQLPRIGVWSLLAPPGWRLRGSLQADMALAGTRSAPQFTGSLRADDLALRSVVDGIEFGQGRLRASVEGARLRIEEFTLQGAGDKGAGGTLTAQGEAAWVEGKPQVRLEARLNRLRASIRTDRQITVSGEVRGQLGGRDAEISGQLKIDQARIQLPEQSRPRLGDDVIVRNEASVAAGAKAPAEVEAPKTAAETRARTLKLNLTLDLGQDLRVEGRGMDTRLGGLLTLSGQSLDAPRLSGTVRTVGGQYRAYG
ncbi:MAG: translocation/assembly module TamB domain-containing protein, partial [Burkholderiaceae bacterium]|nr:translocation/assembly module TamB domain-containing protein [Burkholderiaceae bacterium]